MEILYTNDVHCATDDNGMLLSCVENRRMAAWGGIPRQVVA